MDTVKKKSWDPENMSAAITAYKMGGISLYGAAKQYNVPMMTLSDRIHWKVSTDPVVGHPTVLSKEEEDSLVNYIKYMHERKFAVDRTQVMMLAWAIDLKREEVKRRFGNTGPTLKWWRCFRDRHKELSLRKVEAIDRGRAANAKEDIIQEYFDVLEDTMRKNDLLDKPHLLFNCDESALVLNKLAKKVLVPRKSKHCHTIATANTQHVSVLCCISAAGSTLPPLIVFSKGLPAGRNFQSEGPVNACYNRTPLIRPPSESHWGGRIRGMVAREGFVYEQNPLSVTRNVVVWEGWSLVRGSTVLL